MPYREKTAWLSLAAIVLTFGPYFALVAAGRFHGTAMPNLPQLIAYGVAALAQVLILGAGRWYLRHGAPQEARLPLDERDRAIMHRAMSLAYYVLIAGMIVVGVVMPFGSAGWTIVNAALAMITAAEIVHYAVVVASYRGQA